MLRLLIGKAGSGKTAAVIGEIRRAVQAGRGGSMLLVPEQYSHEAERELCRACGDSLSLYAEVFSFTGLARRVLQQQGGAAVPWLDKGGRLLCMALALEQVGSRLRVYDEARRRSELQAMLLAAVDECKSACVTPEMLEEAAAGCDDSLGDKLSDLALIQSAYDAIAANGRADPSDRLSVLAEKIASSDLGPANRVYVDGFIDFTRQEQAVLTALLQKGVELTVCMTVDEPEGENEIFALSRISCRRLLDAARELGVPSRTETLRGASKPDVLRFFSDPRRAGRDRSPRCTWPPPRASAPSANTPRRASLRLCETTASAGGISPSRCAASRLTAGRWRACSGTTASPFSPRSAASCCKSRCPR